MEDTTRKDYESLLEHWNRAFQLTDEDKVQEPDREEDWKKMAPSQKLLAAAQSLGGCENALDYGSGAGWAGIAIAKSGCRRVTCADPAPNAKETAQYWAEWFGVADRLRPLCISDSWLTEVPKGTFDGFFCSNVLDVVPPEMAEDILRQAARLLTKDARVIVGLNFYMQPEAARKRGIVFRDGNKVYMNGVLRLVNRTDEEWETILARHFRVVRLEHFAWPGEEMETRRLFYLEAKGE